MKRHVGLAVIGALALAAVAIGLRGIPPGWAEIVSLVPALPERSGELAQRYLNFSPSQPRKSLTASGFIQADEIIVSTEVSGRVQMIQAEAGDEVSAGQVLAQLDTALIDAQIQRAKAELRVAEAKVTQVKAGAREEEIEAAEAALARAEREVALAEQGVVLAQANVATAQAALQAAQAELARLRSGASPYDLALAQAQLELAQGQLRGAESSRDSIGGAVDRGEVPRASYDAAKAAVAQAQIRIRLAELQIEELKAGTRMEDLQAAQATVDGAEAELEAAQARVVKAQHLLDAARAERDRAQAQLELIKQGAAEEQIAIAQAQVSGTQAAQQALMIRRGKMTLRAPRGGLVLERLVNVGEMVMAGSTLFRLADLDQVELIVYVPETKLGRIRLGQRVHVAVDSFAGRVFPGHVVYIAPRAEFIPRGIQQSRYNCLIQAMPLNLVCRLMRPLLSDAHYSVGGVWNIEGRSSKWSGGERGCFI